MSNLSALGDLPLDRQWLSASIGDIATVDWGNTSLTKKAYLPQGEFLGVSAAGCDGRMDFAEHKALTPVLSAIGANCGRMFLPTEDFTAIKNTITLTPKDGICNSVFLYYLLDSVDLPKRGAGQPFISKGDIQKFPVSIPSLDEQKRIVAVLDQAFAAIDRARAHAEANLTDVESLFDGALRTAFALRLDWPVKFLPEISENLDRQRVPITKHDRQPGDIPYYGASGVVDQVAGHLFEEDLLLVSEDGANLLARTYPIAFSISGKSWVNNHAHVLRFSDVDTQEYVRLYLNSITLAPYVSGMAQPKLNQKALNQIPILFPDEDRRAAIVAEAALIREHCNALSRSYDAQLTDLTTLRQSLLQKAFSGELT